jgi:FdhD protein
MGRVTTRRPVRRVTPQGDVRRPDTLAVEEPLEIRIGGASFVVTMRTPGDDIDLAHGFLLAEGIIGSRADVRLIRYCDGVDAEGENTYNVLDVTLAEAAAAGARSAPARSFLSTSACGVCGKAALDDVRKQTLFPLDTPRGTEQYAASEAAEPAYCSVALLGSLPDKLRAEQRVFEATGGLHAAGLFTPDGELLAVREDVGRHNAVDKVVGWAVREDRLPLSETVLVVSGRASFELVQKAVMAGVPLLGAVSAPSSLAVDLAAEAGLTLVGFLRGETMNVYTHEGRVRTSAPAPPPRRRR